MPLALITACPLLSAAFDIDLLVQGDVPTCLAVLHYTLLEASPAFTKQVSANRPSLSFLNDERFVSQSFRALRELFDYRTRGLSPPMFLSVDQFCERRVQLVCDVMALAATQHAALTRKSAAGKDTVKVGKREGTADGGCDSRPETGMWLATHLVLCPAPQQSMRSGAAHAAASNGASSYTTQTPPEASRVR